MFDIIAYNRARTLAPVTTVGTGHLLFALFAGTGYEKRPPHDPVRCMVDAIAWAVFTNRLPKRWCDVLTSMSGREIAPLFNPAVVPLRQLTAEAVCDVVEAWLTPHILERDEAARGWGRAGISERTTATFVPSPGGRT